VGVDQDVPCDPWSCWQDYADRNNEQKNCAG